MRVAVNARPPEGPPLDAESVLAALCTDSTRHQHYRGLARPVWDGADPSNVGLVIVGVAVMVTGVFDHRLLARTFGSAKGLNLRDGDAGA